MIRSFRDADERVFLRLARRRLPVLLQRAALKKLLMQDAAEALRDFRNQLEKLTGDRQGQYSIRINERWRICFVWRGSDAHDVEIVDCHG